MKYPNPSIYAAMLEGETVRTRFVLKGRCSGVRGENTEITGKIKKIDLFPGGGALSIEVDREFLLDHDNSIRIAIYSGICESFEEALANATTSKL